MAKFLTKHFQAYDVGFNTDSSTKASAQEAFKGTLLGAGAIAQRGWVLVLHTIYQSLILGIPYDLPSSPEVSSQPQSQEKLQSTTECDPQTKQTNKKHPSSDVAASILCISDRLLQLETCLALETMRGLPPKSSFLPELRTPPSTRVCDLLPSLPLVVPLFSLSSPPKLNPSVYHLRILGLISLCLRQLKPHPCCFSRNAAKTGRNQ